MIGSEARTAHALAIAALVGLAAPAAQAETDEQRALALFEKGRRLAREGRCVDAMAPLTESLRYAEGVGVLLNLGHCAETLGRLATAQRYFARAEHVAAARTDRRREEAASRARALDAKVPRLRIDVPAGAEPTVEVDGETWGRDRWSIPVPVDPGPHVLSVSGGGVREQKKSVTLGASSEVTAWALELERPAPATAPSAPLVRLLKEPEPPLQPGRGPRTQRTVGFVTAGVGAAGLAAGAIFGVVSIVTHASVVDRCPDYPTCPRDDRATLDDLNGRAETTGNVSTVALIAGAALLASGVLLVLTAPRGQP